MAIYKFPLKIGRAAEAGANHVRFSIEEFVGQNREHVHTIHTYMPIGFSLGDQANWNTFDKGMVGAGLDVILNQIGVGGDGAKAKLTQSDIIAGSAENASLFSGVPGIDIISKTARIDAIRRGVVQNPYSILAYEGQGIRSYTFAFKFIAESAKESKEAERIIETFRTYMYPEKMGNLALQYPGLFEIKFYTGEKENQFMPTLAKSHLTAMDTNYNPTGNSFHNDGSPVEFDLSLTFQEAQQLNRDDLYDEYAGKDSAEDRGEGEGEKQPVDEPGDK